MEKLTRLDLSLDIKNKEDQGIYKTKKKSNNKLTPNINQRNGFDKPVLPELGSVAIQIDGETLMAPGKTALGCIGKTSLDNIDGQTNSNVLKNGDKYTKNFKEQKDLDQYDEGSEEEILQKAGKISSYLCQESFKIKISFGEFVRSFFWKSNHLKEKFDLLDEGVRRIEERLNIFNLLKKLREIDKLKLLLLDKDQFSLFDALPKPELSVCTDENLNNNGKPFTQSQLNEAKFIAEKRVYDLVKLAYIELKKKPKPTMIDEKLLEIYENMLDS